MEWHEVVALLARSAGARERETRPHVAEHLPGGRRQRGARGPYGREEGEERVPEQREGEDGIGIALELGLEEDCGQQL